MTTVGFTLRASINKGVLAAARRGAAGGQDIAVGHVVSRNMGAGCVEPPGWVVVDLCRNGGGQSCTGTGFCVSSWVLREIAESDS